MRIHKHQLSHFMHGSDSIQKKERIKNNRKSSKEYYFQTILDEESIQEIEVPIYNKSDSKSWNKNINVPRNYWTKIKSKNKIIKHRIF